MQQVVFENIVPDYISEIKKSILNHVGDDIYSRHLAVLQNKNGTISVKSESSLVCHIKLTGKKKYVEFSNEYALLFSDLTLGSAPKGISRYSISCLTDVDKIYPQISEMFIIELEKLGKEKFGCCSRYVECSNARECLHPDKLRSRSCEYKKHLEAGRIFYGKNRNC